MPTYRCTTPLGFLDPERKAVISCRNPVTNRDGCQTCRLMTGPDLHAKCGALILPAGQPGENF